MHFFGSYEFLLDEGLRITRWNEKRSVNIPMVQNNHITYVLAIILRCLNCVRG